MAAWDVSSNKCANLNTTIYVYTVNNITRTTGSYGAQPTGFSEFEAPMIFCGLSGVLVNLAAG